MLTVEAHPLLDLCTFVTKFPGPLGEIDSSPELGGFLSIDANAPFETNDHVKAAVRDLLRYGGFKPTGRSKPAPEYLLKAATEGKLSSINLAVDVCNVVSLHSGLPISVIDVSLAEEPLRVAIAEPGTSYIFNRSGQTIDVGGLLCLFDSHGPCANAVKDSQRTKTRADTRRTLPLIWGTSELPGRAAEANAWCEQLLVDHGARVETLKLHPESD